MDRKPRQRRLAGMHKKHQTKHRCPATDCDNISAAYNEITGMEYASPYAGIEPESCRDLNDIAVQEKEDDNEHNGKTAQ